MYALTQFGNPILLIVLSTVVGLRLLLAERRVAAIYWFASIVLLMAVTALSKIYFAACHDPKLDLQSPSGHVGFSVLVYGGLGVMAGVGRPAWQSWVSGAFIALGVFAIAVSRVMLHLHTITDIFVGATIGLVVLWCFAFAYMRSRPELLRLTWLDPVGLVAILLVMHHYRDQIEPLLVHIGRTFGHWIPCI